MTDFDDLGSLFGVDPADLYEIDSETVRAGLLRRIAASRPEWMERAVCREEPVDWFFSGSGEPNRHGLDCCGRCPVRQECLDYALADPALDHGVWGGMSARARRARRQTNAKRAAARHDLSPTHQEEPTMSEEVLEQRVEIRGRTDEDLDADLRRLRRNHIALTHAGAEATCRCELVDVEAHEDLLRVIVTFDVDGAPAWCSPEYRHPMTSAVWRAPRKEDQ